MTSRNENDRQLAQQAGTIGVMAEVIEQLADDMQAYHPDMHPVVRANLDLALTYMRAATGRPQPQGTRAGASL